MSFFIANRPYAHAAAAPATMAAVVTTTAADTASRANLATKPYIAAATPANTLFRANLNSLNRDKLTAADALTRFQVILRQLHLMGNSPSNDAREIASNTAKALEVLSEKYTGHFGYFIRDGRFWDSLSLISSHTLFLIQGENHKAALINFIRNISDATMTRSEPLAPPSNALHHRDIASCVRSFIESLSPAVKPAILDLFRRDHQNYSAGAATSI